MAIVDAAYYLTVYMGKEASECDFPALEARAEDVIGAMTRWRATADTIASLTPFQVTLVKKAICAQVDFFAVNGLDSVAGGNDRGFTVGKVSISGKSGSELSNMGAMGVEYFHPIILPPQSGILGIGAAFDEPVEKDGKWESHKRVGLSYAFDHRIIDGALASRFLKKVIEYLEEPLILIWKE